MVISPTVSLFVNAWLYNYMIFLTFYIRGDGMFIAKSQYKTIEFYSSLDEGDSGSGSVDQKISMMWLVEKYYNIITIGRDKMRTKIRVMGLIVAVFLLMLAIGCGDDGDAGTPAVDKGSISGTVKDASNNPIGGATVETSPATSSATTDSSGTFTISNVPIGVYSVTATKSGYVVYTLTGVGAVAGGTMRVSLVMTAESSSGPGIITGTVTDPKGATIAGATVSVEGQSASALTNSSGQFSISNVTPGFVYLYVTSPSTSFLDGETRDGIYVSAGGTVSGVAIKLSGRPTNSATFVGKTGCTFCHPAIQQEEQASAHYHSITPDTSRMVETSNTSIWPAVGGTVTTSITATNPDTANDTNVSVSLCQNTSGVYSMKFGGTASACLVNDGTFVPVSGTYGGEGDGGIDNVPNVGKFKQRFFAKLADVPDAGSWSYATPADKGRDYLILPVQITQSGDGAPKPGAYKNTEWTQQKRTFSRACAGCHNTGMTTTWETSTGNNYITAYNYLDINITCEKCHGPGSEHVNTADKNKIIIPRYLTADAERQVCGQCHAADAGKSKVPDGSFGYAYNSNNASLLGGGTYVPGVYSVADYIKGFGVTVANGGGFDAWPDDEHGKAHRQQYAELAASVHTNNPYRKITCSNCHNTHSLRQGPKDFTVKSGADTYVFTSPTFKNNVLCLACHAPYGPYAGLGKEDIAAIFVDAVGAVTKNGTSMSFTSAQISVAKGKVAGSVGTHMQDKVNMGVAAYNPLNETNPVGRCQSCHMPKTGKSGGYTTGVDGSGATALIEGDQGSHKFDIIWPAQSAALKKSSGGADTDIMPNSCGKCHEGARLSGN